MKEKKKIAPEAVSESVSEKAAATAAAQTETAENTAAAPKKPAGPSKEPRVSAKAKTAKPAREPVKRPKLIPLNREMLEDEHYSVVKELGRVIGVRAPSEKVKEDIITEALKIQSGEQEPYTPTGAGAPKKDKADISKFLVKEEEPPHFASEEKPRGVYSAYGEDARPAEAAEVKNRGNVIVEGVLEQHVSGYGFLRANNYENSREDAYVSPANIKRFNLRRGDKVRGVAKVIREGESPSLQAVIAINDLEPKLFLRRAYFDDLTPYYPTQRIKLETGENDDIAIRCIDLFSPLGMGQRGLIVAPPKTGKTTLLKKIAQSIEKNYPQIKLIMLLIDERPEEVTDMKRSVSGEVVFSTFDENAEHHVRAAELVINRAKRLVEVGQNVVILMDSITRLARAYNNIVESSGKTLSGGLDPAAMYGPKRFFGAARNIEDGGSLTILSTALIDTGSRMDDVIYEEFKGTGNMEIHLSRELSEKRIFPAIDLYKSGTRKEELLLSERELSAVYKLRKILAEREDATDSLLEMMKKAKSNDDFLSKLDVWLKLYGK